jgi:hypothetical protein
MTPISAEDEHSRQSPHFLFVSLFFSPATQKKTAASSGTRHRRGKTPPNKSMAHLNVTDSNSDKKKTLFERCAPNSATTRELSQTAR